MFENSSFFQRKPDRVRAFRLTAKGNVPVTHAEEPWMKSLVASKRLQWGGSTWFAKSAVWTQAAYPGDWIVLHDGSGVLEVYSDERFREMFDAYDPEGDA